MSRGYFDYKDQSTLEMVEDLLKDIMNDKSESEEVLKIVDKTIKITSKLKNILYQLDSYLSRDSGELNLLEYFYKNKLFEDIDNLYPRIKELRIEQHHILVPINYRNNKELIEQYKKEGCLVEELKDHEGWYRVTYKEAIEEDYRK